ncbi:TraR/DksA family transcriptional regulator [Borrelia sp. MN22-0132]|uniref:TraR/DksA family transcriptional regulator n=1 Tax=Borrelia sp. MN22-0132 TaxID=3085635 RepID=UPI003BA108D2
MHKSNFEHEFVEKMRNFLLESKKEILNSIRSVEDSKREIINNDMHLKDIIDIAFDNMDGNNLEALSSVEKKKLHLINQALYRISQNTYGNCLACDKSITKERLEAIPYAFLCISCQTKKEKKSKRSI